MTCGCIFKLVLDRFEKNLRFLTFAVVVNRQSEYFLNFSIYSLFTRTNIPNSFKQFIEVICTKFARVA